MDQPPKTLDPTLPIMQLFSIMPTFFKLKNLLGPKIHVRGRKINDGIGNKEKIFLIFGFFFVSEKKFGLQPSNYKSHILVANNLDKIIFISSDF